jgi:hypothetical protein
VHDAAEKRNIGSAARPRERPALFGRRDPRPQRLARQKACVRHAERLEHMTRGVLVEPLAAHAADDVAEEKEVDVAVDEAVARRCERDFLGRAPDRLVGARELNLELEIGTQA